MMEILYGVSMLDESFGASSTIFSNCVVQREDTQKGETPWTLKKNKKNNNNEKNKTKEAYDIKMC